MFGTSTKTDIEPDHQDVAPAEDPVPLSVLALDVDPPAIGEWSAYLRGRGIEVGLDDIGRPCISRASARMLIAERRESEAHAREVAARREQQSIEQDQRFRAQLSGGVPWYEVPPGVAPAAAMLQAAHDAQPKRLTPLQEQLAGETMVYHSWPSSDVE
jgi:hypothetical protein